MNPSDMTLLLTRPEPAAERFRAQAEAALGTFASVVISPILSIVPLDPFPELSPESVVAFTSENAVRRAAPYLGGTGRRVWCVGDRTAHAARDAGFTPHVAGDTASALAQALIEAAPHGPIVHLSGRHQAGDLVETLVAQGMSAQRIPIYDQQPRALSRAARAAFAADHPVLLPLFSPRSAALVSRALQAHAPRAPLHVAFLSDAVARSWQSPASATQTAERPNAAALIDAMRYLIDAISGA